VYLKHVGKRKLLKAREEQEIGQRIETARAGLQSALSAIPCAVATLMDLAGEVRRGSAPAAELILLPDGGELRKENVTPVLKALDAIREAQQRVEDCRRRCEDRRSTASSREGYRQAMERARKTVGPALAALPLRPSLIDDVVARLRELDRAFDDLDRQPRAVRTAMRRDLERRAGLPRRRFCRAFATIRERDDAVSRPNAAARGEPAARGFHRKRYSERGLSLTT
jgi:hypothetical protein